MTSLSPLATDRGHFTIAAIDHRDALVVELEATGSSGSGPDALRAFKRDVLRALSAVDPRPSAVMLEPEFSLPELRADVPDGTGVTCALEAQGYLSNPMDGNALMDGWTPARVTEVGADAAKLLVLYRHDRGRFTDDQERLVAEVVDAAAEAGVPALIEPVPVEVADDDDRRDVILAAAERLGRIGPMLLKLPYPGAGACPALDDACGERPWALLSWGVTYDAYLDQLTEACAAGCSGFTVGRALWREGVDPAARAEFLATTFVDRFAELVAVAETGRPWFEKAGRRPDHDETGVRSQ